jgi:hypothetical protein
MADRFGLNAQFGGNLGLFQSQLEPPLADPIGEGHISVVHVVHGFLLGADAG